MKTRVMKSPAIIDNRQYLREMRERAKRQALEKTELLEKIYERKKAEIDVNVANRPLLVEMQSKNFYHEYLRMQEVEQYATLLREANFDPNEHLNQEQKVLLQKAEAFEQLNAEHAYFPTVDHAMLQQPFHDQMEGEGDQYGEEGYEDEGEEMDEQDYIQQVNEVPEMEEQDQMEDSRMNPPPQYQDEYVDEDFGDEDYEDEEYNHPPQPEAMA